MDYNYYKISEVYRNKVVAENFGAPTTDSQNSYQSTASMQGPGHGPVNATDGQNAVGGNRVMFPNQEEISNDVKADMLIKFFKLEINEGTWNKKTKTKFKEFLDFLLGYYQPDKDKTEEELMKAARKVD